jgi:hypothetical protein
MMLRILVAALSALAGDCAMNAAHAADMPVKAKPALSLMYPYDVSGAYFGIASLATSDKASINGQTQSNLTSFGGSIGGLIGYRLGGKTGYGFLIDGSAYWNNLGGSDACNTGAGGTTSCTVESRFSAMQRFMIQTDLASITALFPNLGLPNAPAVPVLPNLNITGNKTHLGFALLEDDVSASVAGLAAGRAWTIAPGVVVGTDWNLGNGSVVETWAGYFNPAQGFSFGPVPARANTGSIWKVGLNWKV